MHPALSVIVFTTASGAGYGLLILLGALAPFATFPHGSAFPLVAFGLAFVLITGGLLSSTVHLGRPERAWRAVTQWRSSWLSREGIAALATYVPAGLFALVWIWFGEPTPAAAVLGLVAAVAAAVTIYCTAMIYRSLKPIQRWSNGWVVPNYFALALMSGAVWLWLVTALFGGTHPVLAALAPLSIAVAAVLKLGYWRFIDRTRAASTPGSATGLGDFGRVRQFQAPHTSENYLLKEMGFRIARKHARKLRRIALLAGFLVPFLLALVPWFAPGWPSFVAALVAAPLVSVALLVERWLFFAEARHAVTLYYGAAAA